MSYLVLARKSRPARFSEVVGQKPVVRTLQNALAQDRVAHAMIFSGVRGVGKTTLARIMAKALNCEKGAPKSEPCNECRSCVEISAGSSVDLVEIDGASNRGIQEIRELKENIRFMPSGSRFKIIIIDEVHMLTTEAFNALLKTLEEPPEHVYFMFATTELHRVPVTILSRCQRYELKRVANNELADHFKTVTRGENVEMDPAALNIIVREAGGSVRDGLSLLDQVFSYCGQSVSEDDLVEMLGLVSNESIGIIAEALLKGDIDGALAQLDRMYAYGLDLKRFINDLLSWFRALVICSVTAHPAKLLDLPSEVLDAMRKTAAGYPSRTLTLMFNTLMENLEKAGYSSQPRFAVEMAFIKAIHAREIVPVGSLISRIDELLGPELSGTDKKKTITPQVEPAPADQQGAQPEDDTEGEPGTAESDSAAGQDEQSADEQTVRRSPEKDTSSEEEGIAELATPVDKEQEFVDPEKTDEALQRKSVRKHWAEFIDYVRDRKPWMASALQLASSVSREEGQLLIHYNDASDCGLLKNRANVTPLTEFAMDFFQDTFNIHFVLPDAKQCEIDSAAGTSPQQERKALANDALVLTAVDVFDGEVGDIRVGPRFRKPMEEPE